MRNFLLFIFSFIYSFTFSYSQTWSSIGTGVSNTTGDETAVNAMIVYNGELYIAGCFTAVNGVAAKYIAKFDGNSWSAVGNGLWHTGNTSTIYSGVKCLAIYNGELYAGGSFNQTGSASLSNIAKWNGSAWVAVGNGFSSSVSALCTYNNALYAGGSMVMGGYNGIASWNGTSWSTLGSGMQQTGGGGGLVRDMKVYNNLLYIAGQFATGNGISSQNLITYNGTAFSSIGSGVVGNYGITKMNIFQNDLVIAGGFTAVNGTSAKNIARYNGTNWTALGLGIGTAGGNSYETQPLQEYNNKLVAGGFFTTAGSISVNSVAQWDGTNWLAMGSGITGYVASLMTYNNAVYAGGKFTNAGGISVNNIAKWTEPGVGVDNLFSNENIDAFPNPANEILNVQLKNNENEIKNIALYNCIGDKVFQGTNLNSNQVQLNLEQYSAGIYFIKIETEKNIIIKKVVKN